MILYTAKENTIIIINIEYWEFINNYCKKIVIVNQGNGEKGGIVNVD